MINGNTYDKDIRKWIEKAKATRNMALTNFAYDYRIIEWCIVWSSSLFFVF